MQHSERDTVDLTSLDRPVWSTLNNHHKNSAIGNDLARRFMPDVNLFACARDDSEAAIAALDTIIKQREKVYFLQADPVKLPPELTVEMAALCVQMVLQKPISTPDDAAEFHLLGDDDVPEMLELTALTNPGPFQPRTHTMGNYYGIRINGRLAAMAGERMRFPGFTEVSAVCAHPDFRGQGFARRLSAHVAAGIQALGDIPFLHAWETNTAARSLYQSLGFELRHEMHAAVVTKP